MLVFHDPDTTYDYVLQEQRELPSEEQVVFKLKPVSHERFIDLRSELLPPEVANSEGEPTGAVRLAMVDLATKVIFAVCREGVVGWSNLKNVHGNDSKFAAEKIAYLDQDTLGELVTEVLRISNIQMSIVKPEADPEPEAADEDTGDGEPDGESEDDTVTPEVAVEEAEAVA